jgi:DNA-binding NarL/FixJ family response regulator
MAQGNSLPQTSQQIRVLAADSNRMNNQLLADALTRDSRFRVLEGEPAADAIVAAAESEMLDIVLLSPTLDNDSTKGFRVAEQLRAARPGTRIIILLDTRERSTVIEAFRAGARGIFCRSESLKSLAKCISCVHDGQIWASSRELCYLLEAFSETMPMRLVDSAGTSILSRREQDVVRCVAEGLSNREIASRLHLTEHTVKNYLFRIFDKLGLSSRVEVVLYAFSLGRYAPSIPAVTPITSAAPNRAFRLQTGPKPVSSEAINQRRRDARVTSFSTEKETRGVVPV